MKKTLEDVKIELEAARRSLALMNSNRGIVTLDGNIENVQEWLNGYALLSQHLEIALQIVKSEERGK